jgi:uncharacterized protein YbjT (DUF2867 family)
MVDTKTILIFGATGNQGASVIDAILRDPKLAAEWKIKGVTRDVTKPSAKALEARGEEVVTVSFSHAHNLLSGFGLTNSRPILTTQPH